MCAVPVPLTPHADLAVGPIKVCSTFQRVLVPRAVERAMVDVATGAPLILIHLFGIAVPFIVAEPAA
jgi:hypothetical protein